MKCLLAVGEEYNIVCVFANYDCNASEKDRKDFVYPVHEVGEAQIGEVLTEVVPDRQTWSGVYDLVEEPKSTLALDNSTNEPFQYVVVY